MLAVYRGVWLLKSLRNKTFTYTHYVFVAALTHITTWSQVKIMKLKLKITAILFTSWLYCIVIESFISHPLLVYVKVVLSQLRHIKWMNKRMNDTKWWQLFLFLFVYIYDFIICLFFSIFPFNWLRIGCV